MARCWLACCSRRVGGLGDDVLPVEVRFQQGASYPVDDLMVIGQSRAGERRLFVGVRRSPVIGAGSASFVCLLADYLRMVVDDPAKFEADDWRLGLAVAAPHAASAEVRTLAWIARRQRDNAAFRAAVAAPQATKRKIRVRLGAFDAALSAAAAQAGITAVGGSTAEELTWRLLRALHVIHVGLEGDDPPDRTRIVTGLSRLAGGVAQV